ncbi:MAG TPA: transglycosylase SLT domain-containing protein [Stellaceae bacterium]|nr:transglycosylase SLT domain-containing protein [Stellaceae bacterium]
MTAAVKPDAIAGHAIPPDLLQHIKDASSKTGVDFSFLVAQAALESGFESGAASHRSTAQGLFQFTSQTWLEMMRDHGASYGHGDLARQIVPQANGRLGVADKAAEKRILDLRGDPALASYLAAELAKGNSRQIEHALGRKASAADIRLSLLLGPTGAIRFLRAHQSGGTAVAAELAPQAAKQNPTIFYGEGHTPKSVAAVYRRIEEQIAGPIRQASAIARSGEHRTQVASLDVPLRPGSGLETRLQRRKG